MDAAAISDTGGFAVGALGSSEVRLLVRWLSRRCRWHLLGRLVVPRVTTGAVMVASPMDTALLLALCPKVMASSMGLLSSRVMANNSALIPSKAIINSMGRRPVILGGTSRPRGITTETE